MKTTKKPTEETQEKKAKKEPSNKWTIYPITVTEWENEEFLSYTISKSYKDKEGEWQNTTSFTEADLRIIAKILSKI